MAAEIEEIPAISREKLSTQGFVRKQASDKNNRQTR